MLVLSRRESEKILVPDLGITLQVIAIKGNTVRLGIDAPRDVRVVRAEVADRETERSTNIEDSKISDNPAGSRQHGPTVQPLLAYVRKSQIETESSSCTGNDSQPAVRELRTSYQVCT